jgi:hypothetical protein
MILAALVMWRFPLDVVQQKQLRAQLDLATEPTLKD